MHELSNAAPPPPAIDTLLDRRPQSDRRSRFPAVLAAVVLIVTAIAGAITLGERRDVAKVSTAGLVVFYSRIDVSLSGQMQCPQPATNTMRVLDRLTIDSYSDRTGKRWRSQVTYPNGSTRDAIALGSAVYPTKLYERGPVQGIEFSCNVPGAEPYVLDPVPGQGGFYTLNIDDELAASERPLFIGFKDRGSQVSGIHTDSRGRSSQLWELRTDGQLDFGGGQRFGVTQQTSWWIDPNDQHTITEDKYTNSIDTFGTTTRTETLMTAETTSVPASFFDTSGYTELSTEPRPSHTGPTDATTPSSEAPASTSTVAAAAPEQGDTAVWSIAPNEPLTEASTGFTASVMRLGCNGGRTGQALKPSLKIEADRIIVTFTVEHTDGPSTCPGNDTVTSQIDLGQPIGRRQLIDGSCLSGSLAATTALCTDDGIRWHP